ncbi:MAG: tetratricopeptide repeat protein [Opitutus sp.]
MNPAQLQTQLQAAIGHHRANRFRDAEDIYARLRAAAPKSFDVLHLSGLLAYHEGRAVDAVDLLTRALRLDPKALVCEMRLGLALLDSGRVADAEQRLRRVITKSPTFSEGWDNLAYLLKTQDRLGEALGCHEKSVKLQPRNAVAWYNFGLTQSLFGHYEAALRCHSQALTIDPKYALAKFGRAQALHQADRIAEAVVEYRAFLALEPQHHQARSYLLFALHYLEGLPREELFQEHVAYGKLLPVASGRKLPNTPEPERRLRVAVFSPDLRTHSCAYFLEPLLRHLDPAAFELFLYHDHFREDDVSQRLRTMASVWRNFVGQGPHVVEKTIRADAPDILIDLAGHTGMTNRLPLFAARLAPVQISYLGYPNTTGVPAMDYRFTDAVVDPEGEADAFATEKLIRFAPTAWCYAPPAAAPEPVRQARGPDETVVFGCFNTPAKITDEMLRVWGRILDAVIGSRLLLKGTSLSSSEGRARSRERLLRLGLPVERIELLDRTPDTASHLATYNRIDVALDTFPYHGTTTTCEALWMGVPVVTLAGDRHMSRVGVSLLSAVGHAEWVAKNQEDYVRIALEWATNEQRLALLRANLRAECQRSELLNHQGQSLRFATALKACWVRSCGELGRC